MIWAIREQVQVVELRGGAARRFANGQFTNNVRELPIGAHQSTAMTDERGRLLGLMDLLMLAEDRILLALEGVSAESFEAEYRMLLILEDLEVERIDQLVYTVQGGVPAGIEGLSWPAARSIAGGVDILGELPESVRALARPAHSGELEALRIELGRARWPVDASDKQLPHELGIRDTHLHFEKGCYRGQEIIHRVDVMGQVRKQLVGLRLAGPVAPGAALLAGGKRVGRMGSHAQHPVHGLIGLAVVRNEHAQPNTRLEHDGVQAVVSELPFS